MPPDDVVPDDVPPDETVPDDDSPDDAVPDSVPSAEESAFEETRPPSPDEESGVISEPEEVTPDTVDEELLKLSYCELIEAEEPVPALKTLLLDDFKHIKITEHTV